MLTKLLKIKYPLIQGGMANIATGKFAAAISNVGALGIIAAGAMTPEQLEQEIFECKKLTEAPFGVNIMLLSKYKDELVDVVVKNKVPVVTTGAGNPSSYIDKLKAAGSLTIPVIPSVGLARRMEKAGADAVIAEGTESGGHVGELTTMALVPQVVEAVKIPVIAAGGIASGKQIVAAFALGACGVQVGTCLLVSEECPIHQNYKDVIIKAKDTDTVVTGRIAGIPVRIFKNKLARTYIALEKEGKTKEELEYFVLGALRKAAHEGDIDDGSVMMGQVAGMLNEIKPAKEIIEDLFASAKLELQNLKID